MRMQVGTLLVDDTSYRKAIGRRAEIFAQLQELQTELKDIEEFVTLYERLFGQKAGAPASEELTSPTDKRRRERNILSPARLAELCRQIIVTAGRPMTRTELLEALRSQGVPLVGADPSKNLGTILWRSGKFDQIRGAGYWPKGAPLPT